jgi:hypothetical protein
VKTFWYGLFRGNLTTLQKVDQATVWALELKAWRYSSQVKALGSVIICPAFLCLTWVKARQSIKSGKAEEGRPPNFTGKARQGKVDW